MLKFDDGRKRRRFALLVSLLVHAVFFVLCYVFISPIKVYILDNVREVVIVPDYELIIPSFEERKGNQFSALTYLGQKKGPETMGFDRELLGQGLTQPAPSKMPERQAVDSRISSAFHLGSPDHSSSSSPQNFSFSLSQRSGTGMSFSTGLEKYSRRKNINFSKYSYFPRHHPVQRKNAFIKNASYDLGSWAEKVIASVQQLWFLKPSQLDTVEGQIKVSAAVGKKGQLLSARIVESSSFPLLEKSALSALERSAPFPRLPEAFPGENLEILLVFSLQ